MGKLTIKELAPYLPYGLKIQGQTHKVVHTMCRLGNGGVWTEEQGLSGRTYGAWADIFEIKPLLRPLSQLTYEDIECLNDKYDVQLNYDSGTMFRDKDNSENPSEWRYDDVQYLLKNHYDIFGLIEKGLAIEISK